MRMPAAGPVPVCVTLQDVSPAHDVAFVTRQATSRSYLWSSADAGGVAVFAVYRCRQAVARQQLWRENIELYDAFKDGILS